jgi:Fe2+ transport system protein FeoA
LRTGEAAVVEGFAQLDEQSCDQNLHQAGESDGCIVSMMRLGVLPGALLRVVARSGFGGDPMAIEVSGGRVALGKSEASLVIVKKVGAP